MQYTETAFPDIFNAPDVDSMTKQLGDWGTKALQEAIAGSISQILTLVFTGILILIGIWIVVSVIKVFFKRFTESQRRKQIDALNKARIAERGGAAAKVHVLRHDDMKVNPSEVRQQVYKHSDETDAAIRKYLSPRSLGEMMKDNRVGDKVDQTKALFSTVDERAKESLANTLPWNEIEKLIGQKGSRNELEASIKQILGQHQNWTEEDTELANKMIRHLKNASSRQDTLNRIRNLQRSTTQEVRRNATVEVKNLYTDYSADLMNIWLPENASLNAPDVNSTVDAKRIQKSADSLFADLTGANDDIFNKKN